MPTLASAQTVTFGVQGDQTITLNTSPGTEGTLSWNAPNGVQVQTIGPMPLVNQVIRMNGVSGSATLVSKSGAITYTLSASQLPTVSTDPVTGGSTGLTANAKGIGLGSMAANGYGKSTATPTRMVVAGNSFNTLSANGTGITAPQMYASLLAAKFPTLTMLNVALAGTCINGYWQTGFYAAQLTNTDVVINSNSGYNSLRTFGPANTVLDDFRIALDAFYSWGGLPESAKVRAYSASVANPAVTYGGSWSPFTFGTATGSCAITTGVGATATTQVSGDTVYVFYMRQATAAGVMNVTIDGVQVASLSLNMSYAPSNTGGTAWEPAVFKFTGLTDGAHTVVVTNVNASGSILMGFAGFTRATVSGPVVLAGNCVRMTAAGYAATLTANDPASVSGTFSATWNPQWMYGDGGTQKWNEMQRRAVDSCRNDGLSVKLVDLGSQYIPLSMTGADNIHPNAFGYQTIYGMHAQEVSRLVAGLA